MSRRTRRALAVALAVIGIGGALCATGADGVVFLDANQNGLFDEGESGVSAAVVSNGVSVVRAGSDGRFSLPDDADSRFVFLSTPSGTVATAGWYRAVDADASYDFPLQTRQEQGPLVFAQLSDTHYAPNPESFSLAFDDREMAFLPDDTLDGLVDELNALEPDFVILTGDIIANAKGPSLDDVEAWFEFMDDDFVARLGSSFYAVVGNHDQVRVEGIDKGVFETHFGPTYYSFTVKGVHCVVLDLHELVGTKQIYTVGATQLEWLRQDLALADPNAPILVFCHEPTADWADTTENEELFSLLAETRITALLNGHWHTNFVLREGPFYELTSGAVCGSWWEGPNPDGTEFGYRVGEVSRGQLSSTWRTVGKDVVHFASPAAAALVWADRLVATAWGEATAAAYRWDEGEVIDLGVSSNGLWSTAEGNLNVTPLGAGYRTLSLEFTMADGSSRAGAQTYYVLAPELTLGEIIDHPDVFQGKLVGAPDLVVRAVMGADLSATDGVTTIIVAKFPWIAAKGEHISLVGMYRPTSADPIKSFDLVFSVKLEEE